MAQRGAEGEGLTQSLGEKMQAVIARYGAERPNARRCVVCGTVVADPLMAGHLAMHAQARECRVCETGDLDKHLAHVRAAIEQSEADQAESFRQAGHSHGEPTEEHRIVGDAVRVLINSELDGVDSELLARQFHDTYEALGERFDYAELMATPGAVR
jgi:hypothetical protein